MSSLAKFDASPQCDDKRTALLVDHEIIELGQHWKFKAEEQVLLVRGVLDLALLENLLFFEALDGNKFVVSLIPVSRSLDCCEYNTAKSSFAQSTVNVEVVQG